MVGKVRAASSLTSSAVTPYPAAGFPHGEVILLVPELGHGGETHSAVARARLRPGSAAAGLAAAAAIGHLVEATLRPEMAKRGF